MPDARRRDGTVLPSYNRLPRAFEEYAFSTYSHLAFEHGLPGVDDRRH